MIITSDPDRKTSIDSSVDERAGPSPQPVVVTVLKNKANRLTRRYARLVALLLFFFSFVYFLGFLHRSNRRFSTRTFNGGPLAPTPGNFPWTPSRLRKIEKAFISVPNNDSAIQASRRLATIPHIAGSDQDLVTARLFLELFQSELGISKPEDEPLFESGSRQSQRAIRGTTTVPRRIHRPIAWIDTYYPVLNTGVNRTLEILGTDGSIIWVADLDEDADEADPDAAKYHNEIPTWHGLSKGGDVKGRLVSVKYGRKQDFEELAAAGYDLTGTIALVKYGGVFRGLKIKAAQEAGCIGVIIYSDPKDDGSVTVENGHKPWPHGPARNPTSVQRGSVQFISSYPGDPTTPGYPSYKNATRASPVSIPSIPSIPLSWNNAQRLLKEIDNAPFSSKTIRLLNEVDDRVIPIYNTMAVIPGVVTEQAIMIGNHRDAWVMGAADPTSGSVSLHEVVRGLGYLIRRGWKPLRTIILASWDAEEYGLVGSTEWGEDFADWIQDHVVTYLNLDVAVSGSRYNLGGSPSLAHLMKETALSVDHPTQVNKTLWDARNDKGPFGSPEDFTVPNVSELVELQAQQESVVEQAELPVHPLGSGSDYTVMLQRLGIASTDMGFGTTLSDAVYHYHSVYDSELWQETYADPGFHKHVAVAQHLGLMALRLAEQPVLPINTTHYTLELFTYLNGIEELSKQYSVNVDIEPLRSSLTALLTTSLRFDKYKEIAMTELERACEEQGHLAKSVIRKFKHWMGLVFGRRRRHHSFGFGRNDKEDPWGEIQAFMLAPEHAPAIVFEAPPINSHRYGLPPQYPMDRVIRPPDNVMKPIVVIREISIRLGRFEQCFLSDEGIKDRQWYRHLGVAPGKWKGYGATPFPGLSEAIEIEKNATLAQQEVTRLVAVVDRLVEDLDMEPPSF